MSYRSLSVFFCVWLWGSNGVQRGFKIYRSKLDIFTNLNCTDRACSNTTCALYGAECFSENNCEYCRCLEGRNTFMTSGDNHGECQRDEDIEPKSVPVGVFELKTEHDICLQLESISSKFIVGKNCIITPTLDKLWIRARTEFEQLMNVKTLRCMRRNKDDRKKVTLNVCRSTRAGWQTIQCDQHEHGMKIWWNVGTTERILHLPNSVEPGSAYAISSSRSNQQWRSNASCATNTIYEGCYRFKDGSFMRYLHYNETNPNLHISAPIFEERGQALICNVSDKFKFIDDGLQWKSGTGSLFTINIDKKDLNLQINSAENLSHWNGSLLKLNVSCASGGTRESHCVLLKLESLPKYSEETHTDYSTTTTSTKEAVPSTLSTSSSNVRRPTTTENSQRSLTEERSDSGKTNTSAIAVTVPLVLLALALATGFLYFYRRRKRAQVPAPNNDDYGAVNYSKEIYEDPDRVYETLKDDGNGVSPNQPGTSSDIYSYPDAKPPLNEQEYTYAKETDFPKSSATTRPEAREQTAGVLYETLEPDDDGFYNYPENTNTKAPISTQNEQEYSYAKNTDIPSVPLGKPQNNGHSFPPDGSNLYHTLEEPNPPQLPVYSTLEESAEVDN